MFLPSFSNTAVLIYPRGQYVHVILACLSNFKFSSESLMSSTYHPEELFSPYQSIFNQTTLVRKGLCPVTDLRQQSSIESHSLYFEQHGNGPEKILFIMG